MPNRIIRESICTSDSIDALTAFQETVFYRLIVNCDDYGRLDARPAVLKAKLFPLKDMRSSVIAEAIQALSSAELVILYEVDGKPFLQMKSWDRHQQIRAKKSKYPAPGSGKEASDGIGYQLISSDRKCPRNPIQSESESNPNTEDAYSVDFELFWRDYPRKIDKQKAYRSWKKIPIKEYGDLAKGLKKWNAYWSQRNEPEYIPHPTVWLNNRRWESEPPKITKKCNAALNYQQSEIKKQDFDRIVINLDEQ